MVRDKMPGPWRSGAEVTLLSGPFEGRLGLLKIRKAARPDVEHDTWAVVVGEDTITVSQDCLTIVRDAPKRAAAHDAITGGAQKKKRAVSDDDLGGSGTKAGIQKHHQHQLATVHANVCNTQCLFRHRHSWP